MRLLSVLLMALALVAAAACSSPAQTPTPSATATLSASPTATATPVPGSATSTSTPIPGSGTPTSTPSSGTPQGFFLKVLQPQPDSTVSTVQVTVSGQTTPDAVVTVNGQTVDVAADGSFSTTVTLSQGTNSIEVVASDFAGDQQSAEIPIIYIPQS